MLLEIKSDAANLYYNGTKWFLLTASFLSKTKHSNLSVPKEIYIQFKNS